MNGNEGKMRMRDVACRAGVHPGCALTFVLLGVVRLLVDVQMPFAFTRTLEHSLFDLD
jgi:hypothetical protein